MRKLILLMLLITTITNAQEYKLGEKTITGVFEVKGKTKAEIFSLINKWVSVNYKSAKNVLQMNDLESGTIIIKGINETVYKNLLKEMWPRAKYLKKYSKIEFNHLIEINIKDNRFRIIFKIIDIATEDDGWLNKNLMFKCINFNGINDTNINEYIEYMEGRMKKWLINKKKRKNVASSTKPMFEELSNSLINYIKFYMQSIEKSITTSKKSDW